MLCENFKVGTLDRLGFSYEVCRAWNPRLIYCQNSGFGPVGDWSPRPSFDSVAQAFSGSMHAMGGGPSHPPMLVEWTFSDEVGAMNFYAAILAALYSRERTGKGQKVETSQTAATIGFQRASVAGALMSGHERDDGAPPGYSLSHMQQVHICADDKWVITACVQEDMFTRVRSAIAQAISLLLPDPRLSAGSSARTCSTGPTSWLTSGARRPPCGCGTRSGFGKSSRRPSPRSRASTGWTRARPSTCRWRR